MSHVTIRSDGGARGNPGPAGIGFTVEVEGAEIFGGGAFIGDTTNNVAEYLAMAWALENALHHGASSVLVLADSELVVKQIRGEYRVKAPGLKAYFELVRTLLLRFDRYEINHIYRAENKVADGYANQAMDARTEVGTAPLSLHATSGGRLHAGPTSLF